MPEHWQICQYLLFQTTFLPIFQVDPCQPSFLRPPVHTPPPSKEQTAQRHVQETRDGPG